MHELHDLTDKLLAECDHLDRIMQTDDFDYETLSLAVSVVKRVRRSSTLLVRALAQTKNDLQPEEAQGDH